MARNELSAGQRINGFDIIDVRPLEELRAIGITARHTRTGTELFHILNDDEENLFAFTFSTPSRDSAGAAHILEHSVLCGSRDYPLKDAFIVLAQGSLQTFLNAMTYPDKTVYPAASVNKHDYFNLMGVYGDAVFRPLLAEWTFLQEGWRREWTGDGLNLTGVVYNEMKGAYSSMDSIAGDWTFRSLLPDTAYAHDSGGDPEAIPSLSWDGLKEFHDRHYAPANCRIFLCGDIPTAEQLAFLDDRFLARLPVGQAVASPGKAERWTAPRCVRVPYPAAAGAKSTVLTAWLLGDSTDSADTLAWAALSEILLGHDGSPLMRTLVESRLGEDLAPASGLEGELRETIFAVGLRGVVAADAEKVENLVLGTLERLAADGIPAKEIEAAMRTLEFAHREIRRSGGPFSLSYLRRSLRGWLHGAAPYETLLFVPPMDELKRRLAADPRYFEGLIRQLIAENHRVRLLVEEDPGLAERQAAVLDKTLADFDAGLTPEERKRLADSNAEMERVQTTPDAPKALLSIPHLTRGDLGREVENIPRLWDDLNGTPFLCHDLFTNGIVYLDFAIPADVLEPEDYLYLPLYSRASVASGLPGMDYGEVSSRLARSAGGLYAVMQTSSAAPGAARAVPVASGILDLVNRDWLIYRLKALEDRLDEALDLTRGLMAQADFTDHRRLEDMVLELRNDLDSALAPGGHALAASRAGLEYSRSRAVDEIWGGLSQLEFAHRLAETPIADIAQRLESMRRRLLAGGLVVNCTAAGDALARIKPALLEGFAASGAPRPRRTATETAEAFIALGRAAPGGLEVYASPSLQIGFGSLALEAAPFATPRQAAELVLAHQLSTGKLWETIRMQGGAYGAFAYPDGLEPVFLLATYRDPDPVRSLAAFSAALQSFSREGLDGEELEKAVIGTYAKETRPRTPSDKGFVDFMRLLYGIEDGARRRKLEAIIDMTSGDLQAAAEALLAAPASSAVLAGTAEAEKAAAALGSAVRTLPA